MEQAKLKSCGQCGELERIVRIDTTVSGHTDILKDISQKLEDRLKYSNNFFGGMVASAFIMGSLVVQVLQPVIKPLGKLALTLFAK